MKTSSFRAWTAVFMLVSGVALSAEGFFTPPVGQISESVLWFFAQCLLYAGSALGIDVIIDHKLKSGTPTCSARNTRSKPQRENTNLKS